MANPLRYWLALHPDVKRPIGGVKQMHRLAESLRRLGREATIIQDQSDFHPGWFASDVATISQQRWRALLPELRSDRDVVVLPETFLSVFEAYAPGLPKILFNQNGAYSFGGADGSSFPDPAKVLELYRHPEMLHVLCVSQHDHQLLERAFGLGRDRVSRLVNGLETALFHPGGSKRRLIAYMPRKNPADSLVVSALLKQQSWFHGWELMPIHKLPQSEVAGILQQSLLFLAFGHPEGFGLPVAEALACGCAVAGYSGLGGRELFQLAQAQGVGLEVGFGDWLGFVDAASALHHSLNKNKSAVLNALLRTSNLVRSCYSMDAMQHSVGSALQRWEAAFPAHA